MSVSAFFSRALLYSTFYMVRFCCENTRSLVVKWLSISHTMISGIHFCAQDRLQFFSSRFLHRVLSNWIESVPCSERSQAVEISSYQTRILCTVQVGTRRMALTLPQWNHISCQSRTSSVEGDWPTLWTVMTAQSRSQRTWSQFCGFQNPPHLCIRSSSHFWRLTKFHLLTDKAG